MVTLLALPMRQPGGDAKFSEEYASLGPRERYELKIQLASISIWIPLEIIGLEDVP